MIKYVVETKKLMNVETVVDTDLPQVNVIVMETLKVAIMFVTLDLNMMNVMYVVVPVFLKETVIVSNTF